MVNSKKAKIQKPESVLRVAQRAIYAWQWCSDGFRSTGSPDKASTESHAHYIPVLEKAMTILEFWYSKDNSDPGQKSVLKEVESTRAENSPHTFNEDLSNRFHMFRVHNTEDVQTEHEVWIW